MYPRGEHLPYLRNFSGDTADPSLVAIPGSYRDGGFSLILLAVSLSGHPSFLKSCEGLSWTVCSVPGVDRQTARVMLHWHVDRPSAAVTAGRSMQG